MLEVDPVVSIWLHLFLAAVFVIAVSHKSRNLDLFKQQVSDYRVLPDNLHVLAAFSLLAAEVLAVVLLLLAKSWGLILAAALFMLYAMAMWLNLRRGRNAIDCGCGGVDQGQPISYGLVLRNGLLAVVSIIAAFSGVGARDLMLFDMLTIVLAVIAALLIYTSINQLLANMPHLHKLR